MYTVTCWSIQSLVKSTSSHTHFYCKQKLVSCQPLFLRSKFTLLGHALFQKLKLVSTFWCLFRVYATKTTNFRFWGRSSRSTHIAISARHGRARNLLWVKNATKATLSWILLGSIISTLPYVGCLFRVYATNVVTRANDQFWCFFVFMRRWFGGREVERM